MFGEAETRALEVRRQRLTRHAATAASRNTACVAVARRKLT